MGPSWELAGRDTFLYLGSGSGVRILSIADSVQPRMLGQVNARGLVSQVVIQDSLLFVACGSWGAQIYSVSDPANPIELSSLDAVINDLCVKDTFCYAVGGDSFRLYDVANPSLPVQMGAVADGGDAIVVADGHTFVGGPGPLNVYDVSDPYHPTLVNSLGGPTYDMFVRRNLLFCTWKASPTRFSILNIKDPLSITEVGGIDDYAGDGVYANDSFALVSCIRDHEGLFVFDVSDSSRPSLRDSINPEGVTEWQPYAPSPNSYGYLADDYGGLITLDLHDADSIFQAWTGYQAHQAVDIHVDGQRAYVADAWAGLQILDVADPTKPTSVGIYDTTGSKVTATATARDSLAYASMSGMAGRQYFTVFGVSDPSNPVLVAQESCYNPPEDMVLRDSFAYCAEEYEFQVFNVARPRGPALVGSCNSQDGVYFGLAVQDTLAYEISSSLYLFNVAQPSSPSLVSTTSVFGGGLAVRDTFVYVPYGYDTLRVYSAADPHSLRLLGFAPLQTHTWDVALAESTAAVATLNGLEVFSLENPAQPHWRAAISTPYGPRRVVYAAPYFYAAMWEAGVAIYSAESLGLCEQVASSVPSATLKVWPSPVRDRCLVSFAGENGGRVRLRDVSGRVVTAVTIRDDAGKQLQLDLSKLAAGVYFVEVTIDRRISSAKLVKQ